MVNFQHYFLLFAIISIKINLSNQRCGFTNELQKSVKVKRIGTNNDNDSRFLQSNSWSQIRIYLDYTHLNSQSSIVSPEYIANVKAVMETVKSAFSSLLMVRPLNYRIKLESHVCNKLIKDPQVLDPGIETDLIIFPFVDSEADKLTEAYAAFCIQDNETNRPIAGFVGFGPSVTFTKKNSLYYNSLLVLHEVNHILSMNSALFESFIDSQGKSIPITNVKATHTINGVSRSLIITPKVVEVAKKHFNCDSLIGLELENQGGDGSAGSHWESRVAMGDFMMAQSYNENVISKFSLALMEDSGWYQVSYYDAGLFRYGKNLGCDFVKQPCVSDGKTSFPFEFSVNQGIGMCYPSLSGKGASSLHKFTAATDLKEISATYRYFSDSSLGGYLYADYCPIALNYMDNKNFHFPDSCTIGDPSEINKDLGEVISADSNCFLSTLVPQSDNNDGTNYTRALCYKTTCDYKGLTYTVTVGTSSVTCPARGGKVTISGFNGSLMCADFNQVCTKSAPCDDVFDCIKKKVNSIAPDYSNGASSGTTSSGTTTSSNGSTGSALSGTSSTTSSGSSQNSSGSSMGGSGSTGSTSNNNTPSSTPNGTSTTTDSNSNGSAATATNTNSVNTSTSTTTSSGILNTPNEANSSNNSNLSENTSTPTATPSTSDSFKLRVLYYLLLVIYSFYFLS